MEGLLNTLQDLAYRKYCEAKLHGDQKVIAMRKFILSLDEKYKKKALQPVERLFLESNFRLYAILPVDESSSVFGAYLRKAGWKTEDLPLPVGRPKKTENWRFLDLHIF